MLMTSERTSRILAIAILAIAALVICVLAARGQENVNVPMPTPNAPTPQGKPVIDKAFLLVAGANFGAAALDAWSTGRNLDHGYIEQNIILGKRPQNASVWALAMGETLGWNTLAYFVKRKYPEHKWWVIFPTLSFGGHLYGGLHNIAIYNPVKYPKVR